MKKFFGWLFGILGILLVTVGLAVPLYGIMDQLSVSVTWLQKVYGDPLLGLGVTAAVVFVLVVIGTLINSKLKKAGYFFAPFFGLGGSAALLYVANFTQFGPAEGNLLLGALGLNLANATVVYIASGVVAAGLILGILGKVMRSRAKVAKEKKQRQSAMTPNQQYAPTSRETDLAIASSRTPKIERYVRDPWGNLIKEEEYNERIHSSQDRRL